MTTRALLLALFALLATPVRAQTGITTHDTGHGVATCVRWSPDGRFAATTGHDGRVRAWNAKTWERRELESPAGQHWALAISPDGKHLA